MFHRSAFKRAFLISRRVCLVLLVALELNFVVVDASAHAATYYVATNGSDSNPGTEAAPWKTPLRAFSATQLEPGDTVYFLAGNYYMTDPDNFLYLKKGGRAGAPITFTAYNGGKVTLIWAAAQPPSNGSRSRMLYISDNAPYIVIDGLNFHQTEESRRLTIIDNTTLTPKGKNSDTSINGIQVRGDNATIRNCSIDNFSGPGIGVDGDNLLVENCKITGSGSHGFYIRGGNGTYRYNVLDGSRGHWNQQGFQLQYKAAHGNKIYGNLLMNGQASGMNYSGAVSNNEVFNNVFINAGSNKTARAGGYAIAFWCQAQHDGTKLPMGPGNKIYNNTFIGKTNSGLIDTRIGMTGYGRYCHSTSGGKPLAENVAIYNNIFYPSSPPPVTLTEVSTIRNNIFYNVTGSVPPGNLSINPMLANPNGNTSADAMLTAGSPAIDKAITPFPINDYQGGKRPFGGAADIGAYESGALPRVCSVPGLAVAVPTNVIDPSTGKPPTRPGYVLVGAVPPGFTLSAGTVEKTVPEGTIYRLSVSELSGLTLTPPADYRGTVKIEAFFVPH